MWQLVMMIIVVIFLFVNICANTKIKSIKKETPKLPINEIFSEELYKAYMKKKKLVNLIMLTRFAVTLILIVVLDSCFNPYRGMIYHADYAYFQVCMLVLFTTLVVGLVQLSSNMLSKL